MIMIIIRLGLDRSSGMLTGSIIVKIGVSLLTCIFACSTCPASSWKTDETTVNCDSKRVSWFWYSVDVILRFWSLKIAIESWIFSNSCFFDSYCLLIKSRLFLAFWLLNSMMLLCNKSVAAWASCSATLRSANSTLMETSLLDHPLQLRLPFLKTRKGTYLPL